MTFTNRKDSGTSIAWWETIKEFDRDLIRDVSFEDQRFGRLVAVDGYRLFFFFRLHIVEHQRRDTLRGTADGSEDSWFGVHVCTIVSGEEFELTFHIAELVGDETVSMDKGEIKVSVETTELGVEFTAVAKMMSLEDLSLKKFYKNVKYGKKYWQAAP